VAGGEYRRTQQGNGHRHEKSVPSTHTTALPLSTGPADANQSRVRASRGYSRATF
jgi:hypothetical protein